jgi:hypothetical protein
MDAATAAPGYSHAQKASLCLILYGSAVLCFALAWTVGSAAGSSIAAVGLLIALLAPAFHHLTVENQGDRLSGCRLSSKVACVTRARPTPAHHRRTPGPASRDKKTR